MKRFFARHSKSSALVATLALHGVAGIIATGFVAFKVFVPPDPAFQGIEFERKRSTAPVNMKPFQTAEKNLPKPTIEQTPPKIASIEPTNITIPPVVMIKVPVAASPDAFATGLTVGFDTQFDFFRARAQGEKVCFIVHFGPATIGDTPYSRMTGYTIRKRLEEIVTRLPDYTLFNVACYWAFDTCAMSPKMIPASSSNKQMLMDWMASVNPLEGEYDHCFVWKDAGERIKSAKNQWPSRVEQLPDYSPQWVYPYTVPVEQEGKYLDKDIQYVHWGRAVTWSILTQKPDTIFILTTNYIDGWGNGNKGEPSKMVAGYKKMLRDIYGPDRKTWPTLNVVVLSHAGKDANRAHEVLSSQFGPLVNAFRGDGSVIEDISKFMNTEEKNLLRKYAAKYGK